MRLIDEKSPECFTLLNKALEMSDDYEARTCRLRDSPLPNLPEFRPPCAMFGSFGPEAKPLLKLIQHTKDDLIQKPNLIAYLSDFVQLKSELFTIKDSYFRQVHARFRPLALISEGFQSDEQDEEDECLRLDYRPPFDEEPVNRAERARLLVLYQRMRTMERKVTGFLNEILKKKPRCPLHVCRICCEKFLDGRRLGGHVSRKHPSQLPSNNNKQVIHQSNHTERERRSFLKQ